MLCYVRARWSRQATLANGMRDCVHFPFPFIWFAMAYFLDEFPLIFTPKIYINGICHLWHCVSVSLFMNDDEMRQINRLTFEHTNYCINEILKIARSACSSTCSERRKKRIFSFLAFWWWKFCRIADPERHKEKQTYLRYSRLFLGAKQKIYWVGTELLISNGMFPQELHR